MYVVSMEVERQSFFMIRLVVFPLILIVMLSWSVFWMDRSSLGERISVSFIGILTAVAYQTVVSEILPQISYMTLMHGFLNLSFIIMCATVVINLVVGKLDQAGKPEAGNRVDRRSRWIFPLSYLGLNMLMAGVAFVFYWLPMKQVYRCLTVASLTRLEHRPCLGHDGQYGDHHTRHS
ncbi:MAG: hypothetical protein JRD92_12155 [Deltaproteobacteria bacterium]|nr:hypothetical protein [Deltaproteobacteria bacterium]